MLRIDFIEDKHEKYTEIDNKLVLSLELSPYNQLPLLKRFLISEKTTTKNNSEWWEDTNLKIITNFLIIIFVAII